jgi:hypothetical protein
MEEKILTIKHPEICIVVEPGEERKKIFWSNGWNFPNMKNINLYIQELSELQQDRLKLTYIIVKLLKSKEKL